MKEEIDKLQKQLVLEQSKQLTKSPVNLNLSGTNKNFSADCFHLFFAFLDDFSRLNNTNSIDRFLRNVTAGLTEQPAPVRSSLIFWKIILLSDLDQRNKQ